MRYGTALALLLLVVYYWSEIRAFVYPYVEPAVRGYASTKGTVTLVPSFVSTYFVSHRALAAKNAQLEVTIERLENEVALRDAFIREQGLSKNSGMPESPSVLVLYPLTEDMTKIYSTILLSKGYKDGVEKGGVVYVRGMQPVCTITEVYDRTSLCELFSRGKRVTEAVTASGTIMLSLSGTGGGSFVAEVPKATPVSLGDTVYLRSNPGLTLGSIVSIREDDQSTGMKLYVRGTYNPVTSSVFYMSTRYAR
jgi:cell shape-determining protein MreC